MSRMQHFIKFLCVLLIFASILMVASCDKKTQGESLTENGQNYGSPEDVVMNIGITLDGKLIVTGPKGEPVKPSKSAIPMDISKFHSIKEFGSVAYEVLAGNPVVKVVARTEVGVFCMLVYTDEQGNFERIEHCQ